MYETGTWPKDDDAFRSKEEKKLFAKWTDSIAFRYFFAYKRVKKTICELIWFHLIRYDDITKDTMIWNTHIICFFEFEIHHVICFQYFAQQIMSLSTSR